MPLGSRLPTSEGGDTRLGCRHPTRMSPPRLLRVATSEGGDFLLGCRHQKRKKARQIRGGNIRGWQHPTSERGWRLPTRMSPPKKKESKSDQRWQHPRVAIFDFRARVATSDSDVATNKERKQDRSEVATSDS
jgi:hypothetical protein